MDVGEGTSSNTSLQQLGQPQQQQRQQLQKQSQQQQPQPKGSRKREDKDLKEADEAGEVAARPR